MSLSRVAIEAALSVNGRIDGGGVSLACVGLEAPPPSWSPCPSPSPSPTKAISPQLPLKLLTGRLGTSQAEASLCQSQILILKKQVFVPKSAIFSFLKPNACDDESKDGNEMKHEDEKNQTLTHV